MPRMGELLVRLLIHFLFVVYVLRELVEINRSVKKEIKNSTALRRENIHWTELLYYIYDTTMRVA